MIMLASFLKKSFLGANGQFRVLEIAFRGRGIPSVVTMENFASSIFCFVVGICSTAAMTTT